MTPWLAPCHMCLDAQSYLTLFNPTDCSQPGFSVHGDSPGKYTGEGCLSLLQGIFPTQGLNPGLLHCRQILYHLCHQGGLFCNIFAYSFYSCPPSFESLSPSPWQESGQGTVHWKRWICNAFVANKLSSWKCNLPPYWPVLLTWFSTFPWHLITIYDRKKIRPFHNNVNVTINKDKSYIRANLHIFHRPGKF